MVSKAPVISVELASIIVLILAKFVAISFLLVVICVLSAAEMIVVSPIAREAQEIPTCNGVSVRAELPSKSVLLVPATPPTVGAAVPAPIATASFNLVVVEELPVKAPVNIVAPAVLSIITPLLNRLIYL